VAFGQLQSARNSFSAGVLSHHPAEGASHATVFLGPPDSLAGLRGPYFLREGREEKESDRANEVEGGGVVSEGK